MAAQQPANTPLQPNTNGGTKSFSNGSSNGDPYHLSDDMDHDTALKRVRTAGSISISPELFEKLYLSPQNAVKGDLRKTFGNPTPVALMGFLISLHPLSCDLMGWRGAGGLGAASTGAFFFFGGLLMILGGLLEFVLGNTFPFVVFTSFGAFWLTLGGTLQPTFNAIGAYEATGGASSPVFNASFGFFLLFMGLLCFLYLILSLRTNIAFVIIFLTLVLGFGFLTGSFWQAANGYGDLAMKLQVGGGACLFVTCCAGWWIFFAIMLAALDFPFSLPVGDLSTMIKGASDRAKTKENMA